MKIKFDELYYRFYEGFRVSRKAKKHLLGVRQTKNRIQKRIKALKFDENGLANHHFCPKCGCDLSGCTRNMAVYPEVYIVQSCSRCGEKVGGADNSEWSHVLDKDYE